MHICVTDLRFLYTDACIHAGCKFTMKHLFLFPLFPSLFFFIITNLHTVFYFLYFLHVHACMRWLGRVSSFFFFFLFLFFYSFSTFFSFSFNIFYYTHAYTKYFPFSFCFTSFPFLFVSWLFFIFFKLVSTPFHHSMIVYY